MSLCTIPIKLHNPSVYKRKIIDEAMVNYTNAYNFLIKEAILELDCIRNTFINKTGKLRASDLSKWVNKERSKTLNFFKVEPFKDSLKLDFGLTIANYLRLEHFKPKVGFFAEETKGHKNLPRAISFCRYDTKRDYCLLYNVEKNRYFVKLYLLNYKDAITRTEIDSQQSKLQYIDTNHNFMDGHLKKERFILVPLSFGIWQETYLKAALENPKILRTAKLIKKKDSYFLSINIDLGEHEKIRSISYMGVARGLKSPVNYTVVNAEGKILKQDVISNISGSSISVNDLHLIANEIVNQAVNNKATVILQDLTNKGDRLEWVSDAQHKSEPMLNCSDYNALAKILKYKLPLKGLEKPITVSSVNIFYTCPVCNHCSHGNRMSEDRLICVKCGLTYDITQAGSLNLANKIMKYNNECITIKVMTSQEGILFTNSIIGLNFFTPDREGYFDKLQSEILRIMQNISEEVKVGGYNNENRKKLSVLKKFKNSDFSNYIRFI